MSGEPNNAASSSNTSLNAPTGTRDLYPLALARRRWIERRWRDTSLRHGFDEIDGPTFEYTELYTRKSGDGIVSEIFGVYSGKDEAGLKTMGQRLAAGETGAVAPYALRPEFTPTLARMFAARAGQLPRPTKWFWQQNCYRAEKPQRGRLREFMQWNCDILGVAAGNDPVDAAVNMDVELICTCISLLENMGLTPQDVQIRISHRPLIAQLLRSNGVDESDLPTALAALDKRETPLDPAFCALASKIGLEVDRFNFALETQTDAINQGFSTYREHASDGREIMIDVDPAWGIIYNLRKLGLGNWVRFDTSIVRGLAYYTGMVFEVIADGERAVAGGGRYDNLIATFGGPTTPAVGFGMGDVVLSLLLQDKGLMPSDKQIAAELGLRPDAFVISNGSPEADALVGPILAKLRGMGLHARRSYKTTGKIGKLLKEASDVNSRFAVIIESSDEITLKDMDNNTQDRGPREALLARITPM